MKGLHRKLFRDLKSLRSQVFTLAILIICGVSVFVSSWSSYQALLTAKNQYYEQFHFAHIFSDFVRAPRSLLGRIRQIPGVEVVEGRITQEALVDVRGQNEPALGKFISWQGDTQNLNLIHLRQGRLPQSGLQVEVVVHEAFAVAHQLKLGESLQVLFSGKQRTVFISGIGLSPEYVYALSPTGVLPDDKHFGIFWMRQQDLEALVGMNGGMNSVVMKTAAGVSYSEVRQELDQILKPYGNIQSIDREKQMSNQFVESEITEQRVLAIVIPIIFLSVAAFILNIILSRLIALHRSQIATLKSLGYSPLSLSFHYFQLVTVILIVGIIPAIYVGEGIGQWYAALYRDFFRFPEIQYALTRESVLYGALCGLIPGWLGSAGALINVYKLVPAEALRPPTPPPFHRGILEKSKIFSHFSLYTRMILRTLLMRPLRLSMSILGMSAAIAILINGSFWSDVIDYMLKRQFYDVSREDLAVHFAHPRGENVLSEISSLPGVIYVEGERRIPVHFISRQIKKETNLYAIPEQASLHRPIDRAGQPIKPRIGGILLSQYFQNEYGVQTGDQIELKAILGQQRHLTLTVLGFVEDLMGSAIYAEKRDVHRWFDEEPSIDTVYMRVEPAYADKIYLDLKKRPEVLGITVKKLILKSFKATIADQMLIFTFILVGFAVAISGAVMYNTARIGYSERSWELSSLRILGFDNWKTFEILFFEIAVQALLALVPGLALGYYLSYLSTTLIHNDTFTFPLVIEYSTYAFSALVFLITFLASGFFLYRKISLLNFSEALKARE